MTVNATNVFSGPYNPNGQSANFPFNFEVSDVGEVGATLNGVELNTSTFTVNLNDDGTGEVVFFTPPPGDGITDELYLFSNPSFQQSTTLANQGPYFQRTIEGILDRLAIRIIWLRDRILRVPTLPFAFDPTLVGKFPVITAGGAWGFSSGPGGGTDALRDDLADPLLGPGLVMFDQTEAYGAGSLGERLLTEIDVTKPPFNAQGNGSNEKDKLKAAWALASALKLPLYLGADKTYHLGTMSGTVEETVFTGNGPPKVYGKDVKLTVTNHGSTPKAAYIFILNSYDGVVFEGITVEATNPQYAVNTNGIFAWAIFTHPTLPARNLTLRNCIARNVLSGFTSFRSGSPTTEANRNRGVHFEGFTVDQCYYGLNAQDEGDLWTGTVTVINPRRAYFCYGVKDHDISVHVRVVPGGNTDGANGCIIVGNLSGEASGNMRVRATFEGDLGRWTGLCYSMCRMVDAATGGEVGHWHLTCNLAPGYTNGGAAVRFRVWSYDEAGAIAANKPNKFHGFTLDGNFLDVGDAAAGGLNAGQPFNFVNPPSVPFWVALAPNCKVRDWGQCILVPSVAFRVDARRELRFQRQNAVSGCVFNVPLRARGQPYALQHKLMVHNGSPGFSHSTYREDIIFGSTASPSGAVNTPKIIALAAPDGVGNQIGVTFGGTTDAATVTLAESADYDTSAAFAMLETTYLAEQC